MIYLNGNKIPYFNTTSYITPSSVEVYPTSLIYSTDYRSGNKNADGKGFTVEGMTAYLNSTDGEEFFFAVVHNELDLTETEDGTSVGFIIDLGDTRYVGAVQMRIWSVYYDTDIVVDISNDGVNFTNAIDTITIPGSSNGAMSVYHFNINASTRYIRIRQSKGWTKYRFVVRSVEVFTPFRKCGYKIK